MGKSISTEEVVIEEFLREFLLEKMDYPVVTELPQKPPDRFILLEKTGSRIENTIFYTTIALRSYGETMNEAAKVNEKVKAAMECLAENAAISAAVLKSDYNYTDVTNRKYRYQAVYNIVHY